MKKLLVLVAVVALTALPVAAAFAATDYGDGPGCGPGAKIFKGDKRVMMQAFAATTNGSFGLQTFAISSGTIGCTNNGEWVQNPQATMFANWNFDNLSQEMAQGGGEHLASLATLMGVPAEQQPEFFAMAQEKYVTLIQSGETTPAALLKALHDSMAADPILAKVSMAR